MRDNQFRFISELPMSPQHCLQQQCLSLYRMSLGSSQSKKNFVCLVLGLLLWLTVCQFFSFFELEGEKLMSLNLSMRRRHEMRPQKVKMGGHLRQTQRCKHTSRGSIPVQRYRSSILELAKFERAIDEGLFSPFCFIFLLQQWFLTVSFCRNLNHCDDFLEA